jgi:hypothetical protein
LDLKQSGKVVQESARKIASVLVGLLLLGSGSGSGQSNLPKSLDFSRGVHIKAYDGKRHRGADHYEQLCRVVNKEFGLPDDSVCVNLVFVDQALRQSLNANNPVRFQSADWCGAYIRPYMILMLGEEESDDTFMHEYMHALQVRGVLFKNVPFSAVHQLIDMNEGLLMGSRSYLEFLKSHTADPPVKSE